MGDVVSGLDVINYLSSGVKDIFYSTYLQRNPDKSFVNYLRHIPIYPQCPLERASAEPPMLPHPHERHLEAIPAAYECNKFFSDIRVIAGRGT
jgi:hypothetical protein